jgi:hypothetical protein
MAKDLDTAAEYAMEVYTGLFMPVFFQDGPLWQREWPDSVMWKIPWFVKHQAAWNRWCSIQLDYVDRVGRFSAAMSDPASQLQSMCMGVSLSLIHLGLFHADMNVVKAN